MNKFDEALWEIAMEKAKKLASRDWETKVIEEELSDGTLVFVARNLDLERCIAQGETREQALEELKDATHVHIATSLYYNLPITKPKRDNEVMFVVTPGYAFLLGDEFDLVSQIESVQSKSLST